MSNLDAEKLYHALALNRELRDKASKLQELVSSINYENLKFIHDRKVRELRNETWETAAAFVTGFNEAQFQANKANERFWVK